MRFKIEGGNFLVFHKTQQCWRSVPSFGRGGACTMTRFRWTGCAMIGDRVLFCKMSVDHSLLKFAEEKKGGYASHNHLELIQNLHRVLTAKGLMVRSYERVQRKRDVEIYKTLGHGMLSDAGNEVHTVHMVNAGALNYRSAMAILERTRGKKVDDWQAEYSDMERCYNQWYADLSKNKPEQLFMCLTVCAQGHSIQDASAGIRRHRETGAKYLRNGLNAYCLRRGWGDQTG